MRFPRFLNRVLIDFNSALENSKKLPYFKARALLALVLMFASPFLVLYIASIGSASAEFILNEFLEYAILHPWALIVFATMPFALLIGLIVKFVSSDNKIKN